MLTNSHLRRDQSATLLLFSVCGAAGLFAALIGYRAGEVAWRRKKEQSSQEEERNAQQSGFSPGMQHHRPLRKLIHDSTGRGFGVVKRVYVVPGGGPGSESDAGYPPWTAQRVAKALQRYDVKYADTTAFLALGAGSMNAASPTDENGHVVFESTRIAEELARGGVPPGSIIADFASWDTVGNAWFARMAIEAILDISYQHGDKTEETHASPPPPPETSKDSGAPAASDASSNPSAAESSDSVGEGVSEVIFGEAKKDVDDERGMLEGGTQGMPEPEGAELEEKRTLKEEEEEKKEILPAARAGEAYGGGEMRKWMFDWKAKKARARRGPLNVTVFVSDFHAERMDAVFQWVFGLEPSLLDGRTTVTTVSIDTPVGMWARGPDQRRARQAHEKEATHQARLRGREIRTVEEFRAFMMLGGHGGYFARTHGRYKASAGGGWGGTS